MCFENILVFFAAEGDEAMAFCVVFGELAPAAGGFFVDFFVPGEAEPAAAAVAVEAFFGLALPNRSSSSSSCVGEG